MHEKRPSRYLEGLFGAENGARTRDLNLGKVALYQLSYFRVVPKREDKGTKFFVFSKLFVKKMRCKALCYTSTAVLNSLRKRMSFSK